MALVQRTVTVMLQLGLTDLRVLFTSRGVEVPDDLPTISARLVDEASGGVAELSAVTRLELSYSSAEGVGR